MATIQVREVPEDVYERLRLRARARSESIQRFMLRELVRIAEEPTDEELWQRVQGLSDDVSAPLEVAETLRDLDSDRR